jgi:hypothetical protein
MKVLKQDWESSSGSERTSISKNLDALNVTKREIAIEEESLVPVGEPFEITIPENSDFVEMVECNGTVFLNPDELYLVYNSPELQ